MPRGGPRHRVDAATGTGAIWGLGLARLLAEAGFSSLLYSSPLAVAGVALACAAISFALRPLAPSPLFLAPGALPLLYVVGIVSGPLAGGVLLIGGLALTLLLVWRDRPSWVLPAILVLIAFAFYLRTLLPSVGEADTFEFQVIVPRLAVAHPTGYPLYVLLGKLFTLLPFGNVAWRVNLASAVFATGAVLVLYALLRRLTEQPLLSFLGALAFAFSSTFWSQAIVAEVYALHNLLVAAILWLLLAQSPYSHTFIPTARRWQMLFLLLGLSLTNHLTTALLLPAVALAMLWERPRLRPGDWLIAGGLFLLGLSIYLFIPLRWPALNDGEWMTLRGFLAYITGGQFHGALRLDGWRDPVRWGIVTRVLREPFGWVGLGLAVAGVVGRCPVRAMAWAPCGGVGHPTTPIPRHRVAQRHKGLAVRRRRALALTGVTFLAFLLYGLDYYVADISVFLLPAHLILAIWIAFGVAFLAELIPRLHRRSLFIFHWSLVILFALLPLSRIWMNLPAVDQSRNPGGEAWGQYVLSLPLAEDAAILADTKKFAPLYYLQQVEGVRPDLDIVLLGTEALYQAELRSRLEEGQTVYLARYLPHLEGFYLRSIGPLVEVRNPVSARNRVSDGPLGRFGEAIQLLDADVRPDPFGRALYHLTLHWRAETPANGDFLFRLRLVDERGQVRWASEAARPVGGLYPTNAWPVGVMIADYHEVPIPPWLPPGEYALEVGLFPPFSDKGLAVDEGSTAWLTLRTMEVAPPADPKSLPYERRYSFSGGAWLVGYDLTDEMPAGAPAVVDLAWRGVEQDEQVRLAWVDGEGGGVDADVFSLAAGMLRSRHTITAPQTPGDHTLRVGIVGEGARCGWLAPSRDDCPLTTVEVLPARQGLANFADRVLLLGGEVGEIEARAGEIIPVTLRWRALRAMDEDYTVFVHLVGPDGRLHGQVDAWPVQGTYPTSRWTPGEEVTDRYEVRLDADAPSGHYQVEVGWYLLETMQRLRILNAGGQPVGDSFTVSEFEVR